MKYFIFSENVCKRIFRHYKTTTFCRTLSAPVRTSAAYSSVKLIITPPSYSYTGHYKTVGLNQIS